MGLTTRANESSYVRVDPSQTCGRPAKTRLPRHARDPCTGGHAPSLACFCVVRTTVLEDCTIISESQVGRLHT